MIKRQMTFRQLSELLDVPVVTVVLNPLQTKRGAFNHDAIFYDYHRKVAVFASNDKIYAYAICDKSEKPFLLAKATVAKDSVRVNTGYSSNQTVTTKLKGDNLASVA
jgi:membrane-bound lytic murein transglycosylase D